MGSQCNGPVDHRPQGRLLRRTPAPVPDLHDSRPARPAVNIDRLRVGPVRAGGRRRTPESPTTDSPDAASTVDLKVPQGLQPLNSSTSATASVTLPRGLGLNPSAAPDLQFCSDAQLGKGTTEPPVACPANSQIGTVSIQTPVLPADSLPGKVFLGQQLSRDPTSGNEYRSSSTPSRPATGSRCG